MLTFFIGIVVGGIFGMMLMCLFVVAGRTDEHLKYDSSSILSQGDAVNQQENENAESN